MCYDHVIRRNYDLTPSAGIQGPAFVSVFISAWVLRSLLKNSVYRWFPNYYVSVIVHLPVCESCLVKLIHLMLKQKNLCHPFTFSFTVLQQSRKELKHLIDFWLKILTFVLSAMHRNFSFSGCVFFFIHFNSLFFYVLSIDIRFTLAILALYLLDIGSTPNFAVSNITSVYQLKLSLTFLQVPSMSWGFFLILISALIMMIMIFCRLNSPRVTHTSEVIFNWLCIGLLRNGFMVTPSNISEKGPQKYATFIHIRLHKIKKKENPKSHWESVMFW